MPNRAAISAHHLGFYPSDVPALAWCVAHQLIAVVVYERVKAHLTLRGAVLPRRARYGEAEGKRLAVDLYPVLSVQQMVVWKDAGLSLLMLPLVFQQA